MTLAHYQPERQIRFSEPTSAELAKLGVQRCVHCGCLVPLEAVLCSTCDSFLKDRIVYDPAAKKPS